MAAWLVGQRVVQSVDVKDERLVAWKAASMVVGLVDPMVVGSGVLKADQSAWL